MDRRNACPLIMYSFDNVFFNELALMNFKKGEVVEKEFPFGFTPEDAKFIETVE